MSDVNSVISQLLKLMSSVQPRKTKEKKPATSGGTMTLGEGVDETNSDVISLDDNDGELSDDVSSDNNKSAEGGSASYPFLSLGSGERTDGGFIMLG